MKQYALQSGLSGIDDCNDLPINSVGYTYASTKNSPGAQFTILCFAWNLSYKVQLGISNQNGAMKTRGCSNGSWSNWV